MSESKPSNGRVPGRPAAHEELLGPPTRGYGFVTGAATHVGRVRQENEDSYVVRPDLGMWAVADGMGGYEAGKLASSTVATVLGTIGKAVTARDLLARFEDRLLRANSDLRQIGREEGIETFGTTVAALLVAETFYACSWCGDSRVYLVRKGAIRQLTRDHTQVQELVDEGRITPEEARYWPGRNVITRAIGIVDDPELDLVDGRVEDGDVFLLCSDGLTGVVGDAEILAVAAADEPQAACDRLIEKTLARGAPDNVTIVVVRCALRPEPTAPAAGTGGEAKTA